MHVVGQDDLISVSQFDLDQPTYIHSHLGLISWRIVQVDSQMLQ
jgi:hypothetical protein